MTEVDVEEIRARPAVFVTSGRSAGTLSAVRALGRLGIPVAVGGRGLLIASRWSRFTTEFWEGGVGCNDNLDLETLAHWHTRAKGHVLLASSDRSAWLFALNAERLQSNFLTYAPSLATMETILDKGRLWQACAAIALPTLPSWFPHDDAGLERVKGLLTYPIIIKPRSHLARQNKAKGVLVLAEADLRPTWDVFVERNGLCDSTQSQINTTPYLQTFVPEPQSAVVSVSGFIDRTGSRTVVRFSRKILNRSRPVGIGLLFETIAHDPELEDAALELCRSIKFFGIFEIEFIKWDGQWRIIDFNPRFFHQMALDISSGAPLPVMAYLDATNDLQELDRVVEIARTSPGSAPRGFSDSIATALILSLGWMLGWKASPATRRWFWSNRHKLADAAIAKDDLAPAFVYGLSEIGRAVLAVTRALLDYRRPSGPSRASRFGREA